MKNLNWIYKGTLLALSFFIALLVIKPIGVSTQFSVLTGMIHSSIDSDVIQKDETSESGYSSTNAYYNKSGGSLAKHIKNPFNYDFVFVLTIPLGAVIGSIVVRKKAKQKSTPIQIKGLESVGNQKTNILKTYAPSFLSGFLLLFGARMADGCTSGHMMSGMMQGSVSGFFFAFSVFIVAVPLSIFLNKGKGVRS